ncbi:MAG: Hpt domain-containing protein [Acutalibacter sp.]|jgi:hypothetical protein
MDAVQKAELLAGGIDAEEAMGRFLGNEALFLKFLGKFPLDENYGKLCQAVAVEDWESAVNAAHSLKGMCGNLSITPLYRLFTRQVDAFRGGRPQEASGMMEEITQAYERAVRAIASLEDHG